MGQMRFAVPCRERLSDGVLQRLYLAGLEQIPWPVQIHVQESGADQPLVFALQRGESESGCLYVPWTVPGHGELVLSTASLMERDEPYNLPVELARGVVNRVRNQAAEWEAAGLDVPPEFRVRLRQAQARFAAAVIGPPPAAEAGRVAEEAIELALQAADQLADKYSHQALAARHQHAARLSTMCGTVLDAKPLSASESEMLLPAINSAAVAFCWREIEPTAGRFQWDAFDRQVDWCREHQLRLIGGPLLSNSRRFPPDWVSLWEDDFNKLQTYMLQYVRSVVERYQECVQVWNCAGRMGPDGCLHLTEEQVLRLVVAAIEEVRRIDPGTPVIVSFDRPWGEYMAREGGELSPLHFADTLVRADLGIAGIGVELNLGYWPDGTLPRSLLEISNQIDRWSLLGLPVVVFLAAPSGSACNGEADAAGGGAVPAGIGAASPEQQRELMARLIPLLLAKPFVQGLIWNQFRDGQSPEFHHGGLVDAESRAKPLLDELIAIRRQHLL